jgi:uncharacterized SAM-binding protein YcdF (DUF218 family)
VFAADAIVVLGCGIRPSGRPGPPAARRAASGASAYFAGVAPRILVSGGRRWGAHVEARVISARLVAAGVPRSAIIEELFSLSTSENAIFSAAALRGLSASGPPDATGAQRPPRAAVVTCPWHMARALACFRAAGVDAAPFPTGVADLSRVRRAYLELHEIVCRRLDMRAMARSRVLAASAAAFTARAGALHAGAHHAGTELAT